MTRKWNPFSQYEALKMEMRRKVFSKLLSSAYMIYYDKSPKINFLASSVLSVLITLRKFLKFIPLSIFCPL